MKVILTPINLDLYLGQSSGKSPFSHSAALSPLHSSRAKCTSNSISLKTAKGGVWLLYKETNDQQWKENKCLLLFLPCSIFLIQGCLQLRKENYKRCCCSVARSRLTLCDPMDCSIPGFLVLHYLQEFAQLISIESVIPSNPLILCCLHLLLPSIFPSIRVFSNECRWLYPLGINTAKYSMIEVGFPAQVHKISYGLTSQAWHRIASTTLIGQSKSQGLPRFKGQRSRLYLLIGIPQEIWI